jgi:hypothetical protein
VAASGRCGPPQPAINFCFQRLSELDSLSRFQFASVCVQNFQRWVPNDAPGLSRDGQGVLAHGVRIDSERDARIAMSEPLLPDFHRNAKAIHQDCTGVAERMKPGSFRHLDVQPFQQRPESPEIGHQPSQNRSDNGTKVVAGFYL